MCTTSVAFALLYQRDPRFSSSSDLFDDEAEASSGNDSSKAAGLHVVVIPVRSSRGTMLGVLQARRRGGAEAVFQPFETLLLSVCGLFVSSAIQQVLRGEAARNRETELVEAQRTGRRKVAALAAELDAVRKASDAAATASRAALESEGDKKALEQQRAQRAQEALAQSSVQYSEELEKAVQRVQQLEKALADKHTELESLRTSVREVAKRERQHELSQLLSDSGSGGGAGSAATAVAVQQLEVQLSNVRSELQRARADLFFLGGTVEAFTKLGAISQARQDEALRIWQRVKAQEGGNARSGRN